MSLLFVWMMYNKQLNLGIPTLSYSIPQMSRFQLCLDHKHWSNEFQWQMMNVNYATTYYYHNHTTSLKFMLYHTLGNVTDVAKSCGDCWCTSITDRKQFQRYSSADVVYKAQQPTTITLPWCQLSNFANTNLMCISDSEPPFTSFHQ